MERATSTNASHSGGAAAAAPPTSDISERQAREAVEQGTRKAAAYAKAAGQRGRELLDRQKEWAAEHLHTGGQAVRRAAEKFREDGDENIAGYIEAAGDEVERAANFLEQRDLGSLLRDAQSCARRQPEWFLGGMFVAGLALTRFLKATGPRADGRGDGGGDGGEWRGAEFASGSHAAGDVTAATRPSLAPSALDAGTTTGCGGLLGGGTGNA